MNRDGSFSTQSDRRSGLQFIANEIHALGFRHMGARSLKEKHVAALVSRWMDQEVGTGTIKNRMAHIRWWANKLGKHHIVKKPNEFFGIPNRSSQHNESKASDIDRSTLELIKDNHIRISLELQKAFGLRREEAIKFIPGYADRGDKLVLKPSWTKGGKAREIPILKAEQKELLENAKLLVGKGSMIPPSKNYIQQLRLYEKQTHRAGLSRMHGLRHLYAQNRYEALTGWKCPAAGGLTRDQLTAEQKAIDRQARLQISRELGHERISIVSIYIGR